ncbi:MAG: DUF4340 domain-containing protein [Isosphaeraceae bacterium]
MPENVLKFLSLTEVWVGGLGLSAFLALFWVLRGAPPGQAVAHEDEPDAPRGGYRDRVVAAVSIGMVLILLGAYVAATEGVRWSIPAFALGFGTVLTLVLINQKHRHQSPTLRRTLDVSSAALNLTLVAGVLIVLNVVAFRYGGRPLDMTREGTYSLSPLTLKQVQVLDRPLTFTTFFGRSRGAYLQYDRVRQLLDLYQAANPEMVRVQHVDPFRDLARYEALAKLAPAVEVTQGGGVVVEYGEGDSAERLVVRNIDLFDLPASPRFDPDVNKIETSFKGEDALTSALIRLRDEKKPRIVFTTGHGEPGVDEMETNRPGLGVWKARLTGTGAEVGTVNLLTQDLPDNTALVVIPGPKTPFQPVEVSRLKAHAARKGAVLLLLGDNPNTGLTDFLKDFDLAVGNGLIIEPAAQPSEPGGVPGAPRAPAVPPHPRTARPAVRHLPEGRALASSRGLRTLEPGEQRGLDGPAADHGPVVGRARPERHEGREGPHRPGRSFRGGAGGHRPPRPGFDRLADAADGGRLQPQHRRQHVSTELPREPRLPDELGELAPGPGRPARDRAEDAPVALAGRRPRAAAAAHPRADGDGSPPDRHAGRHDLPRAALLTEAFTPAGPFIAMRHRTTFALLALFFLGLGVLWWADYADIPTDAERRELSSRLLPSLRNVRLDQILRVDVESRSPDLRVSVTRLPGGAGWQLREPVEATADPNLVDTLVANLKELRKSADAGTITGDPAPYGLDAPQATVKLYGVNSKLPLAVLEVGKTLRDRTYVRPGGASGAEVVDARLLGAVGRPPTDWRDRLLIRVPSFRVAAMTIEESDPARTTHLSREDRKWRITQPFQAPADDDKVEGLSAELAALRVVDGKDGFAADDVTDLKPFGLDAPFLTVTVTPFQGSGSPQVLKLGAPVPGQPNQRYAMRGGQNDVVRVDVKVLRETFTGPVALRSQSVVDLTPARVSALKIDSRVMGAEFDLQKSADGWTLAGAATRKADNPSVEGLISRLIELKASEFFNASQVPDPGLDPPNHRIQVWQRFPGTRNSPSAAKTGERASQPGELRVDLRLGRHDALKRTVYAQIAGDPTILAVPDTILTVLPRSKFAFRDLAILDLRVADVDRLTLERGERTATVQAPSSGNAATNWRMVEPVDAPADVQAVTSILSVLAGLRAESWAADSVGDGKEFGLDAPAIRVKWQTRSNPSTTPGKAQAGRGPERVLRIGRTRPNGGGAFANIEGEPTVFTLSPGMLTLFDSELHARDVLTFPAEKAERVVLRWPTRTLALVRHPGAEWTPEPGYDSSGFDFSRLPSALKFLSGMQTPRFFQYRGPFPDQSGLNQPRLKLQVWTQGDKAPRELVIGRELTETQSLGTNSLAPEGPVFIVPTVEGVRELIREPVRPSDAPPTPPSGAQPKDPAKEKPGD